MEAEKKTKYLKNLLNNQNGTFTPTSFYIEWWYEKRDAALPNQLKINYGEQPVWKNRRLLISLIRSIVMCIRGWKRQ